MYFIFKKKRFILEIIYRSRRPVPSLTNPMGNGNPQNNNIMLGNGNLPISQTKKASSLSTQNNFFSFLPSSSTTTHQNKYNNIQTPLVSSLTNPLQRTPVMTNFIQTQNGQSPPPPPHMINGNDIEQNFPPINVRKSFLLFSFFN
jgi:hypothetical protein